MLRRRHVVESTDRVVRAANRTRVEAFARLAGGTSGAGAGWARQAATTAATATAAKCRAEAKRKASDGVN